LPWQALGRSWRRPPSFTNGEIEAWRKIVRAADIRIE